MTDKIVLHLRHCCIFTSFCVDCMRYVAIPFVRFAWFHRQVKALYRNIDIVNFWKLNKKNFLLTEINEVNISNEVWPLSVAAFNHKREILANYGFDKETECDPFESNGRSEKSEKKKQIGKKPNFGYKLDEARVWERENTVYCYANINVMIARRKRTKAISQ